MNELRARRKATPLTGVDVDLKNPDLYTDENYHAVFARLRAQEPVYWNPEADSTGFWAITKYDDVVRVVQDPETFSSALENGGNRIYNKQDVSVGQYSPNILMLDPPRHTEFRRALLPLFTPQAVATLEQGIRARMSRLVDAIAGDGKAEFVTAVAAPPTLGLLTDLLRRSGKRRARCCSNGPTRSSATPTTLTTRRPSRSA